jgi:chromate transporter
MPDERTPLTRIFLIFLRLGLTSFGGPVAHIGYFRSELVERRRWLSDAAYADLVALCQFLPGPASSQVVVGLGLLRGGYSGALAASLGFTLPSLLAMTAFGYGVVSLGDGLAQAGWIHALKLVAAAVVTQAVWAMARALCPDRLRGSIALAVAALLLLWHTSAAQLLAILAAGLVGWRSCRPEMPAHGDALPIPVRRRTAVAMLIVFFLLLALALVPGALPGGHALDLFAAMYRSGALVFGGGHVILPLLEAETVRAGWVTEDAFLAGYGAAQALPGPLFTFAAYLGTAQSPQPHGWLGGLIAVAGIFLPSFLLVFGALPFWLALRGNPAARAALAGVNAAVVGLLLAALYDPVLTGTVRDARDVAAILVAFALLQLWKVPAWALVLGAGAAAGLIGLL